MPKFLACIMALLATMQLAFTIAISAGSNNLPARQALENSTGSADPPLPDVNNYLNPQMGYAEYISSGHTLKRPVTAWPTRVGLFKIDEGYQTTIPYCFVDRRTYELIGDSGKFCKINNALNVWSNAINGIGDAVSGHSLAFRRPDKPEDFCCKTYLYGVEYTPRTPTDFRCDWDFSKYPGDTLAIHWGDDVKMAGNVASATTGYKRVNNPRDIPARHAMMVSSSALAGDIAHEFGHVLGMAHEHQRWDRDDHVEFRCSNIADFSNAINRVRVGEKMNHAQASKALCEDQEIADKYAFASGEFIKGAGLDPNTKPKLDGDSGFDMDSIMLYDSYGFSKAGPHVDTATAVLVAIKKDAQGNKIPGSETMIQRNMVPSAKDIEFVKTFYPWDQAKFDKYIKDHPNGK